MRILSRSSCRTVHGAKRTMPKKLEGEYLPSSIYSNLAELHGIGLKNNLAKAGSERKFLIPYKVAEVNQPDSSIPTTAGSRCDRTDTADWDCDESLGTGYCCTG